MKKFEFVYWSNGNKHTCEIEAENVEQARYWFEMSVPNDDVIEIREIQD